MLYLDTAYSMQDITA